MVSKIGYADIARVMRALEKRSVHSTDSSESSQESEGNIAPEDQVDIQREGDLDPETLQLIDRILAGEEDGK